MAKEILSPDEYQNRLVDFYEQTLGSTGIQTTKPEDDEEKKDRYVAPDILGGISTQDDSDVFANVGAIKSGINKGVGNILDFEDKTTSVLTMDLAPDYKTHLERTNKGDLSDVGKFEGAFNKQSERIAKSLSTDKFRITAPTLKESAIVGGITALSTAAVGYTIGGLVGGSSRMGVDQKPTFKPAGPLGIMADISESNKLDAYNANKAAQQKLQQEFYKEAYQTYSDEIGFTNVDQAFNDYMRNKDGGFAGKIGGLDVYRTHGQLNYQGTYAPGITNEDFRRLEAISKRKAIRKTDGSLFDPLNPNDSEDLVSLDENGGYDERGYFNDVRFGVSPAGRQKNLDKLIEQTEQKNNLTLTPTQREKFGNEIGRALISTRNQYSFLNTDRTGKITLSQAIDRVVDRYKPTTTARTQEDSGDGTGAGTGKGSSLNFQIEDPFFQDSDAGGDFVDMGDDGGGFDAGGQDVYSEGFESYGDSFGSDETGTMGGEEVAMGGRIGMQEGGNTTEVVQPAGFIAPDPNATDQQEIADDKPMDARDGDFIINAPAAEDAGKQDIQRMINTAITNLQEKGIDVRFGDPKINIADKVKLLVSRNEVYIPAIIAKEIGYDRLKKINNRGKREVQRRQEESQQEEKPQSRGFIQKKKGDVVEKPLESLKIKKGKYVRKEIDAIIKSLPTADTLAILMQGEAKNLGDEGLEGAAHVLVNRTNAKGYKNFGRSLFKELTAKYRSKKGNLLFEFNALEPTKFKESLQTFKNNKQKYLKVRNIAEDVLAGSRFDFTGGALFFNNPNVKGDDYIANQVAAGNFKETNRTVNKNKPKILHIYYKPKDFGTVATEQKRTTGFMELPKNIPEESQPKVRIPESKGGSFLFRGSDYETGGATPAF